MLEFTSLVTSLPIELGSALVNLTGISSKPEAFIICNRNDFQLYNEASEQNDIGEIDGQGRLLASLSATDKSNYLNHQQ